MIAEAPPAAASTPKVTFGEAFRFWVKLGFINFGGPAGQIAIMHRELVDEKRWVKESLFLRALNFSMLLPGPEATELAIYVAWRMHGIPGGIVAGRTEDDARDSHDRMPWECRASRWAVRSCCSGGDAAAADRHGPER
jgi:Chromate transporter